MIGRYKRDKRIDMNQEMRYKVKQFCLVLFNNQAKNGSNHLGYTTKDGEDFITNCRPLTDVAAFVVSTYKEQIPKTVGYFEFVEKFQKPTMDIKMCEEIISNFLDLEQEQAMEIPKDVVHARCILFNHYINQSDVYGG